MKAPFTSISPREAFRFSCSPEAPCFNACCRDLYQCLTPYDVLRLKNGLGLSSGAFLDRFTTRHVGPETGLPVVELKQNALKDMECPFLMGTGCSVYTDRPSSCRIYPLARMVSRCRQSGRLVEHYALLREAHCEGFDADREQSAERWIEEQGLLPYNRFNDRMLTLIALKKQRHPNPLDLAEQHLFFTALYDLDRFREQVFEERLIDGMNPSEALLQKAREDDDVLLDLAYRWVAFALFPESPDGEQK